MGTQISSNYDNVQLITTADLWTIHSAVSHVSKEKVCLWVIDVPKLKERYKKKAVRLRYLDVVLNSLQQMRKYRHPRILKILEIAEKKPEIGFSSEPFDKFFSSQISDQHPMDVAYISYQVAEVLAFLSNEARIAYLGLTPSSVLLDDQLSVKLTQFQWSSTIDSLGNVTPSQTYEQLFGEFADVSAKAPEMLKKGSKITSAADVFLFGMFVFEAFTGHKFYDSDDPETILTTLATKHAQIKGESKIPADFLPLLSLCLSPDPDERPTITSILQHQAYQSMQLKSLRYIDIMLTKNPSDKFAFYKGLSKKIDEFSPSIQRIKLLPTLVNECIGDVRFAPVLLGAIFQISVKFTTEEFMELVWRKLSVLSTVVSPPEVSIGLLRNLWMLLEKVDKRLHKDYVYPIIFSALNSQETRIHNEVLKHIDTVIDEMNEETLRSLILPRLFDLSMNSSNISVSSSSILCISKSIKRMDNEAFCAEFIPKFVQIWRKFANAQIASPILEVFFNLNVSLDILMLRVLPVACEICANNSIDETLRSKFCNFIIRSAQDFRDKGENERNFNDQENSKGENESNAQAKTDNDNPFAINYFARSSSASSSKSSANKASSNATASPNPFDNDDDDISNSPFGTRTTRAHSDDTFASGSNNNKSESSKSSAFANFDSPNPFETSTSADKGNSGKDDDEDEGFGRKKNVFSFSNSNSANASKESSNHTFASKEEDDNPFSTPSSSKESNQFSSASSSKEPSSSPFNVANFNRSDNSSGLSKKRGDDFQSNKMSSSQPFNEDIFNNKAFQENNDDVFVRSPSFPPLKPSTNSSTSVFSNSASTASNPSTSVFSNPSSTTSNPSTSVFSNSTQNQSNSTITDFSSNLGLGPISANDIFGSSTAQSSTDNYMGSVFGQGSSMNKPIPAPTSSINSSNSHSNPPSGMDMQATKHQLGSGGFGDFGSSFNSNPAPINRAGPPSGSSGPMISSFGTGLDDGLGSGNQNASIKSGGFGSSNFSSPASLSGFPTVGGNNAKQSFNPFQSDNDLHSSPLSGLPPTPQSHHGVGHGGGFNPFQSQNGGGAGSTDGMPKTSDTNSVFSNQSGRMTRNTNNSGAFQFGQGGAMNPPPGVIPRKKPTQSASYDILDIFS